MRGRDTILYEVHEDIVILTINRPEALNAINRDVNIGLLSSLEKAENDPSVKVVILTGAGDKAFIAGADINEMVNMGAIGARELALFFKTVTDKIWTLKKPVIAAINGYCLGGGLEYAMCCDLRVVGESARMGCPEVNLGILPGAGGTQRMPRLIGLTKAKELCLTGAMINATQALELGLVNYVYPNDTMMEKTIAMAKQIAKKSPVSLALIKAAMNQGVETDLETALLFEIDSFALCFATEEQKTLMKAFVDKG